MDTCGYCALVVVPILNEAAIKKCLVWAQVNKRRDWDIIIWMNETQAELGERPGRERVTWMAGEEFLVDNIQPTFRSSPKFLMLWGCVVQGYKGSLIWLDLASDMGQQRQEGKTRDRKGGLDGK